MNPVLLAIGNAAFNPTPATRRPVVTQAADRSITAGVAWSQQLTATTYDSSTPQWFLNSAPDGVTLSSTGLLEWTPDNEDVGTSAITVAVQDGGGRRSDEMTFNVEVVEGQSTTITIKRIDVPAAVTFDGDDWYHAGRSAVGDEDSKDGASIISGVAALSGSVPGQVTNDVWLPWYTWTGGTPTASATDVKGRRNQWAGGVAGRGSTATIATSTTENRVVRVYSGGARGSDILAKLTIEVTLDGVVKSDTVELDGNTNVAWEVELPATDPSQGATIVVRNDETTGVIILPTFVVNGRDKSNWTVDGTPVNELRVTGLARLDAVCTFPDAETLSLVARGLPAGSTFVDQGADGTDRKGLFTFQAPEDNGGAVPFATLIIDAWTNDATPQVARTLTTDVFVDAATGANPVITVASSWNVTTGQDNELLLSATSDTTNVFFTADELFDTSTLVRTGAKTATLSWAPDADKAGTYSFVIRATDDDGRTSSTTVTATVSETGVTTKLELLSSTRYAIGSMPNFSFTTRGPTGWLASYTNSTTTVQKASGVNITRTLTGSWGYNNNDQNFLPIMAWTDGASPNQSVSNLKKSAFSATLGTKAKYEMTVGTTERTVSVPLPCGKSSIKYTLSLSDGSKPDLIATIPAYAAYGFTDLQFTVKAGAANAVLTIELESISGDPGFNAPGVAF